MTDFLLLSFLLLIAGVIAVPLASKLGLGSVLGYLIAGIVLGPTLIGLGVDVVSLQHFAEFGVVMMLFLVGLELEPRVLWQMRTRLLGLGGLQVGGTAIIVAAAALALGMPWSFSLTIGLVLALSSTAIVLQTLNEKGLMKSEGGQASFSVLLFQDIAVIPMLALIPLLAMPDLVADWGAGAGHDSVTGHDTPEAAHGAGHGDTHGDDGHGDDDHGSGLSLTDGLPGWAQALVTLGAVGFVVVAGSVLTRPLFRFIAYAKLRELFVAAALMMVIGIALLMTLVGLSPALGTFLAGVVLANSEYRHELESDIDPFKGLLLGLFFMTVGAGINFELLFGNLSTIVGLTLGLMLIKALVLYALAILFRVEGADRWLMTLGLAQAGEFGFVLLSFVVANNVLPSVVADQLLLVVAMSMLLTPLLFIIYERFITPKFVEDQAREADDVDEEGTVLIAGHGRIGGIVNRMMRMAGHTTVVLDYSSAQLDMLRKFGIKVFFGDATRPDILHAAGIHQAKVFVIAIDDKDQITELAHYVHHNHPHVHIIARAIDRGHVYDLYHAGCRDIIRETFDSSVRMGRSALQALGMHPFEAEIAVRDLNKRDREMLLEMAQHYDPNVPMLENEEFIERGKQIVAELEQELLGQRNNMNSRADRGWHPPSPADQVATSGEPTGDRDASDK